MTKRKANIAKLRSYAYLSGMLMVGVSALMWRTIPSDGGFIDAFGPLSVAMMAVFGAFSLLSLAALVVKLIRRRDYRKSVFTRPAMVRLTMGLYWLVALCFLLLATDRLVLRFVSLAAGALHADKNPQGFLASMIYMLSKGRSMFLLGIWTTVRIALFGTAIAFVLALLMVSLRTMRTKRQDNDLVRLIKRLGVGFSKLYITVIRGTPMMVQALIIYYAGFALLKETTMSITEINNIWSAFTAGLITVSLNSTAYLAEVLRGGIDSIDSGQTEAARSLGMTNWQAMIHIVFPQAVKNSIPAIGNEFIINIKDSSVLSVIACYDLMFATTSVVGIYYRQLAVYCIAAIVYLIMTYLSSLLMRAIATRLDAPAKGLPSSN